MHSAYQTTDMSSIEMNSRGFVGILGGLRIYAPSVRSFVRHVCCTLVNNNNSNSNRYLGTRQ